MKKKQAGWLIKRDRPAKPKKYDHPTAEWALEIAEGRA